MFGTALLGGIAFGAVATASPVSAPTEPTAPEELAAEEAASVRPESVGSAAVIDLSKLDAAVDAARLAEATTTTTAAAPVTEGPAAPAAPSTTTTTAPARPAARTAPPPPPPPPPAPQPAAAPAPSSSAEQAIAHWFPEIYDQAVSVARCESSMNPNAVSSGGGNHGLFQINNVHRSSFESVTGRPWADIYDADANSQFARYLYDQSGWDPWACQP